jgi:hypothetical protein
MRRTDVFDQFVRALGPAHHLHRDRTRGGAHFAHEHTPDASRFVSQIAPAATHIHWVTAILIRNSGEGVLTQALAGWKCYITNLTKVAPEFVIDAYHQSWHIKKCFRMSNTTYRPG